MGFNSAFKGLSYYKRYSIVYIKGKGKGKFHPRTGHEGPEGE